MEIRRAETDAELADALSVRRAVFIEEQGVPEDRELDGRDGEATHFVAYDGDAPVGAARFRDYEGDAAKVERVAVLERRRGEGIGRELMAAVEAAARGAGHGTAVLHAQEAVIDFYEGLGYRTEGERFEDAGIPHRRMSKPLSPDP